MSVELVVPTDRYAEIRRDLLATPDRERAGVGYAGVVDGPKRRLLLREFQPVRENDYAVQLGHHLEVSPTVYARAAKRARETREAIVIFHSHPGDHDWPQFSPSDDDGERLLVPKIKQRADVPVAAVVVSPGGETGRIHAASGPRELLVRRTGSVSIRETVKNRQRFSRQVLALGADSQSVLGSMKVGVVGVGGLGAHVVQQLVHLGVGQLLVIDPDRVERSNLSRLVGATSRDALLRRPKARAARRAARRIGGPTRLEEIRESVLEERVARRLLDCDVVLGCTDTQWSRAVLNAVAFHYYVPVIDLGVELQLGGAMGGRLTWLTPERPCLWCLGVLDAQRVRAEQLPSNIRREEVARGYIPGMDEPTPAVVSINGVVASLGVTELLAFVTGFAGEGQRPGMLMYRVTEGVVRRTSASADVDCTTCSPSGYLGAGDLAPAPWRPGASWRVQKTGDQNSDFLGG